MATKLNSTAAAVALLGTLLYINTTGHQFVLDDETAVRDNPVVHRFDLVEIFLSDYWAGYHADRAGLYRPLTVTTFAVNYALGGNDARAYHLVNAILHGCVVLVVFCLIDQASRERRLATLGALIFAAHPVQTEAVAGLVGRADLLATLFALLALQLQIRSRTRFSWGGGAAFIAALLCKESAIVLPLLIAVFNGQQYRPFFRRCHLLTCLQYGSLAVLYLTWRWYVLGVWTVPDISALDNPLAALEPELRILNAFIVLSRYLHLLVLPVKLSADYSFAALAIEHSMISGATLLVVAGAVGLGFLGLVSWRQLPWVFVGGTCAALSLLPVSNLIVPIGAMMGERFLYLPSFGFSLALASALLAAVPRFPPRVAATIALCYLCSLAFLTIRRTQEWRDNFTLFAAAAESYPNSARIWRALANAQIERGDHRGAQDAWRRALEIYPDYYEVFNDLGGHHIQVGEYSKAAAALRSCLRLAPNYPPGWFNLALVQYRQNENAAAMSYLRKALELNPRYAAAQYNMGVILVESGKLAEARLRFAEALESDPDFDGARHNLEALDQRMGRHP